MCSARIWAGRWDRWRLSRGIVPGHCIGQLRDRLLFEVVYAVQAECARGFGEVTVGVEVVEAALLRPAQGLDAPQAGCILRRCLVKDGELGLCADGAIDAGQQVGGWSAVGGEEGIAAVDQIAQAGDGLVGEGVEGCLIEGREAGGEGVKLGVGRREGQGHELIEENGDAQAEPASGEVGFRCCGMEIGRFVQQDMVFGEPLLDLGDGSGLDGGAAGRELLDEMAAQPLVAEEGRELVVLGGCEEVERANGMAGCAARAAGDNLCDAFW